MFGNLRFPNWNENPALSAKKGFKMRKTPKVTVDIILEKEDKIILVKRGIEPWKGKLALPGGHVEYEENVENAAIRETKEETNLNVEVKDILGVYSESKRDPRYHAISTVFIGKIINGNLEAGSDANDANFYNIKKIKKEDMSFDHWKIIKDYLKWKENKGTYWSSK